MNKELLLETAIKFHREGAFAKAEETYCLLIKSGSDTNLFAILNLCALYQSQGRYKDVLDLMEPIYRTLPAIPELSDKFLPALVAVFPRSRYLFKVAAYFYRKLGWRNFEVSIMVDVLIRRSKYRYARYLLEGKNLDEANNINLAVILFNTQKVNESYNLLKSFAPIEHKVQWLTNLLNISLERGFVEECSKYAFQEKLGQSLEYDMLQAKFLHKTGELSEAEALYKEISYLHPELSVKGDAFFQWATNYLALKIDQGDLIQALNFGSSLYQHAPRLFFSNYLFLLNYSPYHTLSAWRTVYNEYDRKFSYPKNDLGTTLTNKIKTVGFISGDFNNHVVMHFFSPFLDSLKESRVRTMLFSNSPREDFITSDLQSKCNAYRSIYKRSASTVAKEIKSSRVDLLIDLSGHTAANRLDVFALSPAPLSGTWMGSGCTTGMNAIDFFFGDSDLSPKTSQPFFSEKIINLNTSAVYQPPPIRLPCLSQLPSEVLGYVTFGCLTRLIRINDEVLKVWRLILDLVPKSRLLIDQIPMQSEKFRASYLKKLASAGIDPNRVILRRSIPHSKSFDEIDVVLDPFPHNGGTSTIDALLAGVPIVSLVGERPFERISYSILKKLNLERWAVNSVEEYIKCAVRLSANLDERRSFRSSAALLFSSSAYSAPNKLTESFLSFLQDPQTYTAN
jgi:predicted O-linked N-acetylglucosamine transferase (SPINDLY family)